MTRKPRRHALSVPVRSGSEVGFPQSLGEVHDMLYDKSLERDNCGFGLIAHIEGEPSHKVVRTAIHALARKPQPSPVLPSARIAPRCCMR
ncbi:hypothetical protein ACUOFC_03290, partial [Escherichia sp. TWPC-MK]